MPKPKRRTKNTPYFCPECLEIFYIENKEIYPFIYKGIPYCKNSCMTKAKKEIKKKELLRLK